MTTLLAFAALWMAAPFACGGDEFAENVEQCQPQYKMCGGKCVYSASATYGCAPDKCDPCPLPAAEKKHMVYSCEAAQCSIACETGFGLCGADANVGCDTNLQDNIHHCGWCKHDCGSALCDKGACAPVTLASGQSNPSSLTVAGQFVYWANKSDPGAILRAPIEGGEPEVIASDETLPHSIALDDTRLFFTTLSNGGEIRSVLLAGGSTTTLAAEPRDPAGIARLGGKLFWASESGGEVLSLQVPLEGEDKPKAIKSGLDKPSRVAASDNGWIVYTALGAGDVYCYRDGENLRISTGLSPTFLATAGDEVYFVRSEGYVYRKSCQANLSESPKYVPGSSGAIGLALDAEYLYFSSAQGIRRVPLDGGESPVIQTYSVTTTAQEVAVNSQYVFWTEPSTGEIKAVAK